MTLRTCIHAAARALVPALLPMLLSLSSCVRDDYAPKGTASVTMTFTSRAVAQGTPVGGEGLDTRERMQSLRVIVARATTGEIVYNLSYDEFDKDPDQNGRYYKTVTFGELTVNADGEDFDFYAIANEEGIGYTGNWDNITVSDLQGMTLNSSALAAMNSSSALIPQTGYARITVKPQENSGTQRERVSLEFAVAKVKLTVKNTSDDAQTVSGIAVAGVNMTSTPLFAGQPLPAEAGGTLNLTDITSPAGGEASVTGYIYANRGGAYRLSAVWNGQDHTIDITDEGVAEIPRGMMLHITVTLTPKEEEGEEVEITDEFDAGVYEWDEADMDIEFS